MAALFTVQLDASTRSLPPEVYFGSGVEAAMPASVSSLISLQVQHPSSPTLPSLVFSSLEAMGDQYRGILANDIVFCRGCSLLPGLQERVRTELLKEANEGGDTAKRYLPTSPVSLDFDSQRAHAAWVGGSMLASLSTFPSLAITREMYNEGRGDKSALIDQQVGAP